MALWRNSTSQGPRKGSSALQSRWKRNVEFRRSFGWRVTLSMFFTPLSLRIPRSTSTAFMSLLRPQRQCLSSTIASQSLAVPGETPPHPLDTLCALCTNGKLRGLMLYSVSISSAFFLFTGSGLAHSPSSFPSFRVDQDIQTGSFGINGQCSFHGYWGCGA